MKKAFRKKSVSDLASAAFAQVSGQSPWENAVSVLQREAYGGNHESTECIGHYH